MISIQKCDMPKINDDLLIIMAESGKRGLRTSSTWASELFFALSKNEENPDFSCCIKENPLQQMEFSKYTLAKFYFDGQEYDRASYFTKECTSPIARFLHYYSLYCSYEKKLLDDIADGCDAMRGNNDKLKSLHRKLQKERVNNNLDGYGLFLLGIVLKKLQLTKRAIDVLCEAIQAEPLNWEAWLALSPLVIDQEMLEGLPLPNHWIKTFFNAHTYVELQSNELALSLYLQLKDIGFSHSTYIMSQIAVVYHNIRDSEKAISSFQKLLEVDPNRLEKLDIYSNLLYINQMNIELSFLAHKALEIDKYRVETCCIIGNYYSLRMQHEKAVLYFQRALRLNPNYHSAWTLIGHEYMEMKNTSLAIQSYRQAVEVNRRDFRAWYGLGQTYEILKMPFYCLYYYKKANVLKPQDSRMLIALGEAYEKLDKQKEAKKCYWNAHSVGDIEGMALVRLARVSVKLGETEQAAAAFNDYIHEVTCRGISSREELCQAFIYLAKYYYNKSNLKKAYENAQQCMAFQETREDAKTILKQIASVRAQMESTRLAPMDDNLNTPVTVHITPMSLSFDSMCS